MSLSREISWKERICRKKRFRLLRNYVKSTKDIKWNFKNLVIMLNCWSWNNKLKCSKNKKKRSYTFIRIWQSLSGLIWWTNLLWWKWVRKSMNFLSSFLTSANTIKPKYQLSKNKLIKASSESRPVEVLQAAAATTLVSRRTLVQARRRPIMKAKCMRRLFLYRRNQGSKKWTRLPWRLVRRSQRPEDPRFRPGTTTLSAWRTELWDADFIELKFIFQRT